VLHATANDSAIHPTARIDTSGELVKRLRCRRAPVYDAGDASDSRRYVDGAGSPTIRGRRRSAIVCRARDLEQSRPY